MGPAEIVFVGMWPLRWLRPLAALTTLALALLVWTEDADARAEDGTSLGPSGFAVAASAASAASAAPHLPLARKSPLALLDGPPAHPGSLGGLFNRPNMRGGFASGFFGAGLLGLLFGDGLLGGLGGGASYVGLLVQLALVAMLGRVMWVAWRNRDEAPRTGLSPRQLADAYEHSRGDLRPDTGMPSFEDLQIADADYEDFDRVLQGIHGAVGRDDREGLRALVTPDMMGYFAKHQALDAVSGSALGKDDLANAWSEGDTDYATVALRAPSAQRIRGPEMWTFVRTSGHGWQLSAIQRG
jgi:predicted lipid-binding transport protein (Tim44 family)